MSLDMKSLLNHFAWGAGSVMLAFGLAAGFAQPFGSVAFAADSPVDPLPADAVALWEEEAPDTGLTLEELERLARTVHATEIVILRPPSEEVGDQWVLFDGLGSGVDRSRGKVVHHEINFDLPDGIWLFPNGGTLFHQEVFGDAGSFVEVKERTLVVSGSFNIRRDIIANFNTSNGGVTCGPGYYACCGKNIHGQWFARCTPNGTQPGGGEHDPTSCINGGEHATGCSNGTAILIAVAVREVENPLVNE